jgi:predicted P-loop ATPase
MGYLNNKDYKKVKNIIETFIDTPSIIDNLFKSLVLFLETKNKIHIQEESKYETISTDSEATLRVEKVIKAADIALDKFSKKTLNESRKLRKNSKVSC